MGSGESKQHATPLHQAEFNLLEKGKHFFQGSYGVEIVDVPIGGDEKIHTLRSTPAAGCSSSDEPPLVLVHGYGSGVGMWFASLPLLVSRLNRQVNSLTHCTQPGTLVSTLPDGHARTFHCAPPAFTPAHNKVSPATN